MPKPNVHVLLVSAQAAPNMLPALDLSFKPSEAILLVTDKMKKQAEALAEVLKNAGVKATTVPVPNEHDFGALEELLLSLAAGRESADIALNVTGGTKLMALAAHSVAVAAGWRVFYVDIDTDEVIWLDKPPTRKKLTVQIRLPAYLAGYGFKTNAGIDRPRPEPRHDELLKTLVMQVGTLGTPLATLNYLAQKAGTQLQVDLSKQERDSPSLETLLRDFQNAKVLTVEGGTVRFSSEVDRYFANGGWLEHYVYQAAELLHGPLALRDKAANLEVIGDSVKNELDVAFLAKNRLFVIECKTARMDGARAGKANDSLFKLSEILRRVGGLGARGMLASYRQLGEAEKDLAKALNITVVAGSDLSRLDEKIKVWVNG